MNSSKVTVLGVDIDVIGSYQMLFDVIRGMLAEPRVHRIVTVNPEILLEAERNPTYRELIQTADVRTADGIGIVLAAALRGRRIRRITGSDLLEVLLQVALDEKLNVFVATAKSGLSSAADVRARAYARYSNVNLRSEDVGVGERASDEQADIVLANFGAPLQEQWLAQSVADFPKARIFVGVGGAIDYFIGKISRAPVFVRAVGLEWLWRLFRQPRRVRRIYNAVLKFPIRIIYSSLRGSLTTEAI